MTESFGQWMYLLWYFGIPVLFVGIVAWVFRRRRKQRYADAARIPFHDEAATRREIHR